MADDLIGALGFDQGEENSYYGRYNGFPVALRFFGSETGVGFIFLIRHPLESVSVPAAGWDWGPVLGPVLKRGAIEIEVEPRLVRLTINPARELSAAAPVLAVVDAVLHRMNETGLRSIGDRCHYCGQEPVAALTYRDSQVSQICPECLRQRENQSAQRPLRSPAGMASWIVVGGVTVLAAAVVWALVWIGYDRFFEWRGVEEVEVPHVVIGLFCLVAAVPVGGPIGWVAGRFDRRRNRSSTAVRLTLCVSALLLGEVGYVAWLIFRATGGVYPLAAVRLLPAHLAEAGVMYLFLKLLAAVFSAVAACVVGTGQKRSLGL